MGSQARSHRLLTVNHFLPDYLTTANQEFACTHPGDSGRRQPVHTVYGGAHLFKADMSERLGRLAEQALAEYAPDAATLALALDIPNDLAEAVYDRVVEKLRREPVEDFRIDFEDGYGNRPDPEEDAAADAAAEAVANGMAAGTLPPFLGIRIKPLNEELKARSIRTLDRFVSTLLKKTGGRLPDHFVVTLPKITVPEQVRALVGVLAGLGDIPMEIMVETPQSIFMLPRLVEEGLRALQGRAFRNLRLHSVPGNHRRQPAHASSRV